MKFFALLLPFGLLFACNQSIKKDLTTGSFSQGKGIGCNDVKTEVNGKVTKRTEYVYGEKVNFIFNNVVGLKKINGKVFPGLSICILDSKKDTIISNPEVLNLPNGTNLSPLQLTAYFNAAMPAGTNEKYMVHIDIWDNKGTGTFHHEMPFTVKENNLLSINSQGVECKAIYLWDETEKLAVIEDKIDINNKFFLIFQDVLGLKEEDGIVHPAMSLNITDNQGNKIIENPNVLEKYTMDGVDPKVIKTGQIPVTITFTPGRINNPCKISAVLTDAKSDNKLEVEGELMIE